MSYRQVLRELAYDTHGVITIKNAEEVGVPAVEVRKLASRGALVRIGQGVYRMTEAPTGPLDEFAEAVALAGEDALLADEAVLAALDLTPVNLRRIRVATPRRVRSKLPATVELVHRLVGEGDRDYIDGVPAMTVSAAIRGARGRVMTDRLVDAVRNAVSRGLLRPHEQDELLAELL